MKQKVVIRVTMNGQKCRSKALKIAVSVSGVESAALGGNDKSQIEVIGEVDAVELTSQLRKRVGYAELVSVSAVGDKKQEEKKKEEVTMKLQPYVYSYDPITMPSYQVQYNRDPYYYQYNNDPACSIM